jgi:hypothetical protein
VNERGYREILGICEGAKEDKTGWSAFLKHPKERGLKGVRLITSDACIGLAESAARVVGAFPDGQSALTLAAARLRHIAGTAWSTKRYLNIELLKDQQMRNAITV